MKRFSHMFRVGSQSWDSWLGFTRIERLWKAMRQVRHLPYQFWPCSIKTLAYSLFASQVTSFTSTQWLTGYPKVALPSSVKSLATIKTLLRLVTSSRTTGKGSFVLLTQAGLAIGSSSLLVIVTSSSAEELILAYKIIYFMPMMTETRA